MTASGLGRFSDKYTEMCRTARLRRRPELLGQEALRLDRGDFYAFREGTPSAPGPIRVAVIGDPSTVLISDNRMWWVPRLDQLVERLEGVVSRREQVARPLVSERIARQFAERVGERDRSWEEVALEVLLEHEATGR